MADVSCPWVWLSYSETPHGQIYTGTKPAVLKDSPMPRYGVNQALEDEADRWLAKADDGHQDELPGRQCSMCDTVITGRGNQKTCSQKCRQKLSYHSKKVESQLRLIGLEMVNKRLGGDEKFRSWLHQAAIQRLTISPDATAVEYAEVGAGGDLADDIDQADADEILWSSWAPNPEQAVTGDRPAWQRVKRYDNPHHLRWPWRLSDT